MGSIVALCIGSNTFTQLLLYHCIS